MPTYACDACRARKVKCDNPKTSKSAAPGGSCSQCRDLDIPCTFDYKPRRRGPPSRYLSKLNGQSTQAASQSAPITLDTSDGLAPFLGRPISPTLFTNSDGGFDQIINLDGPSSRPWPFSSSSQPSSPFNAILPRDLLLQVIDLFFEHIYPLIPCVHRPTFMQEVGAHKELEPGNEEWSAMVLALVASTLVQIPRTYIARPRQEVRRIVQGCYEKARSLLYHDFNECSTARLCAMYNLGMVSSFIGVDRLAAQYYGGSIALMFAAQMHIESTYASWAPVERELRRRLFWLLYVGNRSNAITENEPIMMSDDDIMGVALPVDLDDDAITVNGYLEQPTSQPSLIKGYNYITRLFMYAGQIIVKRRVDQRTPPTGIQLQMRLNEVDTILTQVQTLMNDAPQALRFENAQESGFIYDGDWLRDASSELRDLFRTLNDVRPTIKDAYRVQLSNIYISQQMIRIVILEYRDQLVKLQRQAVNQPFSFPPASVNVSSEKLEEERNLVIKDLLANMQKIPLTVIAVNSLPIVAKVRFIASTLLASTGFLGPAGPDASSPQASQAQSYLLDILRIMGEIEAQYSLEDKNDVALS